MAKLKKRKTCRFCKKRRLTVDVGSIYGDLCIDCISIELVQMRNQWRELIRQANVTGVYGTSLRKAYDSWNR